MAQWLQRDAHQFQAKKDHSETKRDKRGALHNIRLEESAQDHAEADGDGGDQHNAKRDKLHGDGGSDVRAKSERDRLLEGNQPCVDEAGDHRRGWPAENQRGKADAPQKGKDAMFRDAKQEGAQAEGQGPLKPLGDKFHSVEKKAEAADDKKDRLEAFHRSCEKPLRAVAGKILFPGVIFTTPKEALPAEGRVHMGNHAGPVNC